MNNNFETSPNIHTYKLKLWFLALNIFSMFFMWVVMGIPLTAFVLMLRSMLRAQSEIFSLAVAFGCVLTPLIILMGLNIVLVTISTISSFFSYIKISSDGIEQKYALSKHIRCKWSDLDRLGKLLLSDVIYLHTYEVIGTSLSLKSPFRLLRPKQGFISLTSFEGWSEGQLASDLKQYAPQLFEIQPISQAAQSKSSKETKEVEVQPETISISQEIRLLAAISHASILFPNVGFFIPAAVYLTQKKKSTYLGYQALQAFIWQIVMFVFSILASSCMVGSIFIPILLTTASQNEKLIGVAGGGVFVAMTISILVMTIGNLGFIIYGIVGAVMTYRGKEFRYVFIGNRINKGKGARSTNSP